MSFSVSKCFDLKVVLPQEQKFLQNHAKMERNGRRLRSQLINSRMTKDRIWYTKLQDYTLVNAFYFTYQNYALIGPGMARLPMFDPSLPAYISYAALGEIIGHEITHGFDTTGRKYDGSGMLLWKAPLTGIMKYLKLSRKNARLVGQ